MTNFLSLLNGEVTVFNFKEGTEVIASVSPTTQELLKEALTSNSKEAWHKLISTKGTNTKHRFITIEFNTNMGDIRVDYFFNNKVNMVESLAKHIARYDVTLVGSLKMHVLEYLSVCKVEFPLVFGFNDNDYLGWLNTNLVQYNYRRLRITKEE